MCAQICSEVPEASSGGTGGKLGSRWGVRSRDSYTMVDTRAAISGGDRPAKARLSTASETRRSPSP